MEKKLSVPLQLWLLAEQMRQDSLHDPDVRRKRVVIVSSLGEKAVVEKRLNG